MRFSQSLAQAESKLGEAERPGSTTSAWASARTLVARIDHGQIVGAVHLSLARESFIGWPIEVVHASMGQLELASLSSQILVCPGAGEADVSRALAVASYEHLLDAGIALDFAFVDPGQAAFYEGLGYRNAGRKLSIRFHADSQLMLLFLHDANHLRQTRSPLAAVLSRYEDNGRMNSPQIRSSASV